MSHQTPYQIDLGGLQLSPQPQPKAQRFGVIALCFLVTLPLTIFTIAVMTVLLKASIPLMITVTVIWVAWRLANWCAWWCCPHG